MNHTHSPLVRVWHHIRIRPRLASSILIGVAAYLTLPATLGPTSRALMSWDLGAGLFLMLAWSMFARTSIERMRWYARLEDDGAMLVLVLTVGAAVASLAGILMVLSGTQDSALTRRDLRLGLVAVTFLASWLLVHTSFALHYAHAYYGSRAEGAGPALEFPGQEPPLYVDFMYFAMVIGMTSQTADVGLANTRMRRLVMTHGLIAFAFNTTLLALTINIAASLLS